MWYMEFVAPQHVESSQTRNRTCVPCTGGQILNHCATREVPELLVICRIFNIPPLKVSSLDFYLSEIGKPKSLKCPTNFYIICTPPAPTGFAFLSGLISFYFFPTHSTQSHWSSCCLSGKPGVFTPQDLCTGNFLCLEFPFP